MFRGIGKVGVGIIVAVIAVIAFVVGSIYIGGAIQKNTAPFRGSVEQTEKVQGSGEYRIAAYDHFYDLCGQAQAQQQNIGNTKDLLKDATGFEKARLNTTLQAQKNVLNETIAQYNADASKADTLANFKASNLPYKIYANEEISCDTTN